MAGLTESYCQSNETSHASQFKWLDNTFNNMLALVKLSFRKLIVYKYCIQPECCGFAKYKRIRINEYSMLVLLLICFSSVSCGA
jgi:hypothetical protein